MSYFDRLPLYVNHEETFWFWGFSIYNTQNTFGDKPLVQEQNINEKQESFQQPSQKQQQQKPEKPEKKEKISDNKFSYNEWVDEMLEKMYLNEDGQHPVDMLMLDNCEKGYDGDDDLKQRESEELMFQFDLDWDIEKGKL